MGGFLCPLPVCAPCAAGLRACSIFNFFAFAFSCLTFASQNSFHLSLMPRRAPHFLLRKENGGKEPRGERRAAPLRTPFLRPAANLLLFRAADRLNGPSGRKPPAGRETLEKPGSRAQLFKRFCAKGDACALWLISPFLSLLAGLAALRAANRRLIRETPEKPRSRAQLFGRFCAWGNV